MHNNPYATLFAAPAVKEPGFSDGVTKLPGQGSAFADHKGQINASTNKDLIEQIGRYITASNEGNYQPVQDVAAKAQIVASRREAMVEAFNDNSGEALRMLGSAMAMEIYETTNREGFARKLVQYDELGQGEVPSVTLKTKDVVAYIQNSPTETYAHIVRDKHIILPEFNLATRILAANSDLQKSTSDILEEKYEEGLEAIMVQEDRLWRRMAVKAAETTNTVQNFTSLTPAVVSRLLEQVTRWGIPPQHLMFSTSMWIDIQSNAEFHTVMDPVTQRELLTDGYLGSLYGTQIYTDNFRQPNMKVLDTNEILVVGAPINHGAMRMRGQLTVEPINLYPQGIDQKGWFFNQIMCLIVSNSLSVARGVRV